MDFFSYLYICEALRPMLFDVISWRYLGIVSRKHTPNSCLSLFCDFCIEQSIWSTGKEWMKEKKVLGNLDEEM